MSFVSPDPGVSVGGISVSNAIGPGAPVVAGVHAGDVLAFTGAGPGTFYLAIIGFVTLAAGLAASFFSRRNPAAVTVQAPVNGLHDLSPLAEQLDD
jgi:hypothetical protein